MSDEKVKIIIVDDHPLVREGLRKILEMESELEVIDEAGDGQGAINVCRERKPDVVLMDINMPGQRIEATGLLKDSRKWSNRPDHSEEEE